MPEIEECFGGIRMAQLMPAAWFKPQVTGGNKSFLPGNLLFVIVHESPLD
jgi:hypothetical protein